LIVGIKPILASKSCEQLTPDKYYFLEVRMLERLKPVIAEFDLPEFIARHYPESLARPTQADSVRAVWRGDRKPSFCVYHKRYKWLFFDHATLEHGDAYDFLVHVLGVPKREVIAFFLDERKSLSLPPASCKVNPPLRARLEPDECLGILTRHYDYLDAHHELVLQVLRYEPKNFRQRRPSGEGPWVWGVTEGTYYRNALGDWTKRGRGEAKVFPAAPKVLYHYPHVLQAIQKRERLVIVDGEKDVETLSTFSITATCSPKGMGSWQDEHSRLLKGAKHVVMIADNESHSEIKVERVRNSLLKVIGVTCQVTRVPVGKDVSDYVAAGATGERLEQLLKL
jgi:putative DNA primase/helicase